MIDFSSLYPGKVGEVLAEKALFLAAPVVALSLWEKILSPAERCALGNTLEEAFYRYGTLGMYGKARGLDSTRSALELAKEYGILSQADYGWLLRETGQVAETALAQNAAHPLWDNSTGTILFGKRVLRRLRLMAKPSNLQKVLDAFQAANWRPRVANPLTPQSDFTKVHQTLKSLNQNLPELRFHAHEGGRYISWEKV